MDIRASDERGTETVLVHTGHDLHSLLHVRHIPIDPCRSWNLRRKLRQRGTSERQSGIPFQHRRGKHHTGMYGNKDVARAGSSLFHRKPALFPVQNIQHQRASGMADDDRTCPFDGRHIYCHITVCLKSQICDLTI